MVHARGPFGETILFGIQTASLFLPKDWQYRIQSHTATQSWNMNITLLLRKHLPSCQREFELSDQGHTTKANTSQTVKENAITTETHALLSKRI